MIVVSRRAVLAISLILAVTWPLTARATNPAPGNACLAGEANTTSPFGGGTSVLDYTSCLSNVWTLQPVQPGAATASCASGTAGQIQWTGSVLQYCNGSSWSTVGTSSTAGSNGYVQFNSSGSFGADSNLFWDNTNKRLGIGTTSPTTPLHVYGSGTPLIQVQGTGTSGYPGYAIVTASHQYDIQVGESGSAYPDSLYVYDNTNSTIRFLINASGNVGIGTTSPTALLSVLGTSGNLIQAFNGATSEFAVTSAGAVSGLSLVVGTSSVTPVTVSGATGGFSSVNGTYVYGGQQSGKNYYQLGTSWYIQYFPAGPYWFLCGNLSCAGGSEEYYIGSSASTPPTGAWITYNGQGSITLSVGGNSGALTVDTDGNLLTQGALSVIGNSIIIETANTPADNATCMAGTIWWDTGFIYVCTASGTVKRAALSAF